MSVTTSIEKTGRTVSEAVEAALNILGIPSDEAVVTVLEEPTRGILGIGGKPARVSVRARTPEDDEPPAQEQPAAPVIDAPAAAQAAQVAQATPPPAPVAQDPPKIKPATAKPKPEPKPAGPARPDLPPPTPEELEAMAQQAIAFLQKCQTAFDLQLTYTWRYDEQEGNLTISCDGTASGRLVGHRGECIDALQYITALVTSGHPGVRLRLDADGYRTRRLEALQTMAAQAAETVLRTRKSVTLDTMPPAERRLVHTILQANPYIITQSEGAEPHRRIVVLPREEEEEA